MNRSWSNESSSKDNESIYSFKSTSSSIFSTSSRLNKIPSTVKSSIKSFVKNNTISNKLKRHTSSILSRSSHKEKEKAVQQDDTLATLNEFTIEDEGDKYFITEQSLDSKNEKVSSTSQQQQEPWQRQRAKSCQEQKIPTMLHQLANKGSSIKLKEKSQDVSIMDLPLFKDLVTTTITTLHTRLLNECDKCISLMLMDKPPQEQLLSIISDLHKMIEMVNWTNQEHIKEQVKQQTIQVERAISTEELNIINVKEYVLNMKQLMNSCLCQYYKIIEKAMIIPSKGYKIEGNNKFGSNFELARKTDSPTNYFHSKIDHMNSDANWYKFYFNHDTDNIFHFFDNHDAQDPLLISIKVEENNTTITNRQFRIICRTKSEEETVRKIVLDSFLLNDPLDQTTKISDSTWKSLIETTFPHVQYHQLLKMTHATMLSSGIHEELARLDENCLHNKYKFGVLLIKEGQTKEEEWFSNEETPEFNEFLNIIGTKIELKGYQGWAAGLDTKSGDSGQYSYINHWNENQLAYHVSTLIPSKRFDKQQIQRKKHIGNDIICIVFVQGNQPFSPTSIKSQFLHVFIVVHQELDYQGDKFYRIEIVSVKDVPDFGPPLPEKGAIFYNTQELESFLIAKLINAEYAAFKSPKFAAPMSRAREGIFCSIVEKGWKLLYPPAEDDVSSMSSSSSTTTLSSFSHHHHHQHTKSSSSSSSIIPSASKSTNAIIDMVSNMNKRKSAQDLKVAVTASSSTMIPSSRQSEESKASFKQRILTSFPGFKSS